MTREEAKTVFLNRGYVEVEGGTIFDANKWREACVVISEWLEQEPCEDTISRQAVKDLFCRICMESNLCYRSKETCEDLKLFDKLPPVKPQEKTGHWNLFYTTEHGMREDSYFKCDRCNYESYKEYNFCPNCGARMIEPQERSRANE